MITPKNSAKRHISNITILLFKLSMMFAAVYLTACSHLSGSSATRAQKLSVGIQKAYSVQPDTANRVAPMIIQSAKQHDVDPLLIAAMIRQESSYRPYVTSSAGAVGLTQIIPRYWQSTCGGNLFDEYTNVNCGTYILAKYNQSAGSWEKALAYYNVGPTGYQRNWKMKRQGKKYAKSVKHHKKMLKAAL